MSDNPLHIIALDFDGVLAQFDVTAWLDDSTWTGKPIGGMRETLGILQTWGYSVVVFTRRPVAQVEHWLRHHGWPALPVTNEKPPGMLVMLDDRAVCFSPEMAYEPRALALRLATHRAWWEHPRGAARFVAPEDAQG